LKPLAEISLPIGRNRRCRFVVWPTPIEVTEEYHKHDGEALPFDGVKVEIPEGHSVFGFCLYDRDDGDAEIHLALSRMGAPLFAHELQHLMEYEFIRRADKGYYRPESLPSLSERIHRKFWRWYYRNFEAVEPKVSSE